MKKKVPVIVVIILCIVFFLLGAGTSFLAMQRMAPNRRPNSPYMTQGGPRGEVPPEMGMPEDGTPPGERHARPGDEQLIGEEKAKEIALEKAGLTADEVSFDRVELDRENGGLRYEVEFKKELTEYSAEISAIDGTIVSWEVETVD